MRRSFTLLDDAVAAVSHMPQLISSLVAARLEALPEAALELAGQGIRDVTRIAASDPLLWSAIVVGNAGPVAGLLRELRDDLDALIVGIEPATVDAASEEYTAPGRAEAIAPGAVSAITDVMSRGNAGRARIPGKHGGAPRRYAEVQVLVPDEPGTSAACSPTSARRGSISRTSPWSTPPGRARAWP